MKDESNAAEAMAEVMTAPEPPKHTEPFGSHEFDGAVALGTWVIVEQVPVGDKKLGSIIVPGTLRQVVWKAVSVGPDCKIGVKVGDRVLFMNGTPPVQADGRTFTFLRPDQVVCTLPMPAEAPMVQLATSFHKNGGLQ